MGNDADEIYVKVKLPTDQVFSQILHKDATIGNLKSHFTRYDLKLHGKPLTKDDTKKVTDIINVDNHDTLTVELKIISAVFQSTNKVKIQGF